MGTRQPFEQPDRVQTFAGKLTSLASLQGQDFSNARQALIDQMREADREANGRQVKDQDCFARLINADIKEIQSKSPAASSPASVSLLKWMIGE